MSSREASAASVLRVLLLAGFTVGCSSVASSADATRASAASATQAQSPSNGPSAAAASTPDPAILTLTDEEALDSGTYRIDLDQVAGTKSLYPSVIVTVPDGWSNGGWLVNKPSPGHDVAAVSVLFWDVEYVYGHPCQWKGTLFLPGETVDELADALADIPMRNASQPVDVTIGGYSGKYLEWSVPADVEFDEEGNAVECDGDLGGPHDFKSWTGRGALTNRYHQGAGQVDRVWILDVDGTRLVIDGMYMPFATDEDRAELTTVVESVRFEP